MEKTATLNIRVKPGIKENAERVLSELGISMSSAIDMYLRQIILVRGIPFDVIIPEAPDGIIPDYMTDEEFLRDLEEGMKDVEEGRYKDAKKAFAELKRILWGGQFRGSHAPYGSKEMQGNATPAKESF